MGESQVRRQQIILGRSVSIDLDGPTILLQSFGAVLRVPHQLKRLAGRGHTEQPKTHLPQRRVEAESILQLPQRIAAGRRPIERKTCGREPHDARADAERTCQVQLAELIALAPIQARLPPLRVDGDRGTRR